VNRTLISEVGGARARIALARTRRSPSKTARHLIENHRPARTPDAVATVRGRVSSVRQFNDTDAWPYFDTTPTGVWDGPAAPRRAPDSRQKGGGTIRLSLEYRAPNDASRLVAITLADRAVAGLETTTGRLV